MGQKEGGGGVARNNICSPQINFSSANFYSIRIDSKKPRLIHSEIITKTLKTKECNYKSRLL